MYNASDLRKGLKIEIDGDPCIVTEFNFVKPGKGQALYRCKIKNLTSGSSFDKTYRAADRIDQPNLESLDMIYSYQDGNAFIFMDAKTYEEVRVGEDLLGDLRFFLTENMEVEVLLHNHRPIEITLPNFVEKRIIQTEPGARGDTATNVLKAAKLEGGYELQVPLFVNEGDLVRIDTRTRTYDGRVK